MGTILARRAGKIERWAIRVLCAIALLFVGLAHQMPVIEKNGVAIDVAQYVLPDGTLPIFCITDNGDPGQNHKMRMEGCQACHINASILIPTPADVEGSAVSFVAAIAAPISAVAFTRRLFPPNTGPRGPPSILQTA